MLVASFSGLNCSITHLHDYQCQQASLMNTQQFIEPLLYLSIFLPYSLSLLLKIGKYTAKLTCLWNDNFGKHETPLQRNGMAAIPKRFLV